MNTTKLLSTTAVTDNPNKMNTADFLKFKQIVVLYSHVFRCGMLADINTVAILKNNSLSGELGDCASVVLIVPGYYYLKYDVCFHIILTMCLFCHQ